MMRLVPFETRHALEMDLRDFDRLGIGREGGREELARLADAYAAAGQCWTALEGESVVGCGGVAVQPGGTGNAWALTSPLVGKHELVFARAVRRLITAAEIECGLNRIQTTVHQRHDVPRRWFAFLGFEREGLMRNFIGNDNYYLYARTNDGS